MHLDWRKGHYIKTILDEVFGESHFQSEICWQRHDPHNDAVNRYGRIHDVIYWYTRSDQGIYNSAPITERLSAAALKEFSLAVLDNGKIIDWDDSITVSHRRFEKLDDWGRSKERIKIANSSGEVLRALRSEFGPQQPRKPWTTLYLRA